MTYTPLWTERAERYRAAIAYLGGDDLDPGIKPLVDYGAIACEGVRGNFPDIDRSLLGWVLLDAAGGLKQVVEKHPSIDPRLLVTVLMAVGKNLIEGEKP